MAQVIKRTSVNPWGQAFGAIGQGLSGFGSGYMAGEQLNMMKDYNALLAQQFGRNGEKIQPPFAGATQQPTAAAQPAQSQPTTTTILPSTPANAGARDASTNLSDDDWKQLLAQAVYKQPSIFGV